MKTVDIAVWGLGPHARRNIVPAILACPGLKLRGLCSRNREILSGLATELNCRYWEDPETMLADPEVEVVYLSTPIGLHAAQGQAVLQAGKHLWCEKPLGVNLAQVNTLISQSLQSGRSIAEGFMYLYHPQFAALKALLSSGKIGEILSIACRFGIPPLERPGFRLTPELGGGAFLDVGCYPVSAAAALYPDTEPEVLLSEIVTKSGDHVDSSGRAVLRYRDGARASLEWGVNCAYRNEIDIWGSTGSLRTDLFFSKPYNHVPFVSLRDLKGVQSSQWISPANHFVTMLSAFLETTLRPDFADQERRSIGHRARLMEKVRLAGI